MRRIKDPGTVGTCGFESHREYGETQPLVFRWNYAGIVRGNICLGDFLLLRMVRCYISGEMMLNVGEQLTKILHEARMAEWHTHCTQTAGIAGSNPASGI